MLSHKLKGTNDARRSLLGRSFVGCFGLAKEGLMHTAYPKSSPYQGHLQRLNAILESQVPKKKRNELCFMYHVFARQRPLC